MNTDERIHAYCRNASTQNNNGSYLQDIRCPNSSQIILYDYYVNTHYYVQNHLNDEIKI